MAETYFETKLHPKASRPWLTASSQIELSFTWSLFRNEDDTLILPRLKPRTPSRFLPSGPLLSTHTQSPSPEWGPTQLFLCLPTFPLIERMLTTSLREHSNSFPDDLPSPRICPPASSARPSWIQFLRTPFPIVSLCSGTYELSGMRTCSGSPGSLE